MIRSRGRVIYVVASADLGGAERCLNSWLPHLESLGWGVAGIFAQREGRHVDLFRDSGHSVLCGSGRSLRHLRSSGADVASLMGLIRASRADLVHSAAAKGQVYGGVAARLTGRRALWFLHDIPDQSWLNRIASRIPGRVLANSEATATAAAELLRRRAKVVHPAVEVERFALDPVARRDFRNGAGWAEDELVVGYLGRLQRWKGPEVFIRALAAAQAGGARLRGAVIGSETTGLDGGYEIELRALAASLDLGPDRLTFLPFQPEPRAALWALDALVSVPITPEPFGMTVVEAMAAGRWVIATAAGGHLETVTSETGELVPAGGVDALAQAILRFAADPQLARGTALAGPKRAAGFSARLSAEQLSDVYGELLTA